MYEYRGTVLSVYDADTCRIRLDLGLHVHVVAHIRLDHINAPELRHADGARARDRLVELLNDGPLIVRTTRDKTEKYGRWLGVIINASGLNVGATLVDEGLAWPYEGGRR